MVTHIKSKETSNKETMTFKNIINHTSVFLDLLYPFCVFSDKSNSLSKLLLLSLF